MEIVLKHTYTGHYIRFASRQDLIDTIKSKDLQYHNEDYHTLKATVKNLVERYFGDYKITTK